jgi:hypothetical protein
MEKAEAEKKILRGGGDGPVSRRIEKTERQQTRIREGEQE